MIDESKWINPCHGLELKEGFKPNKRDNENGILFLHVYFVLKYLKNWLTKENIKQFDDISNNIRSYKKDGTQIDGLYDRGAGESRDLPPEEIRSISHDNLTAISCFSKMFGLKHNTTIADMLISSKGKFDNKNPENQTWVNPKLHPRDLFLWLINSDKKLHKLLSIPFLPVYLLAALEDCLFTMKTRPAWYDRITGKDTRPKHTYLDISGPQLWFIRHECMLHSFGILYKPFYALCKRFYKKTFGENWIESIMTKYYMEENHPCRLISKDL